MVVSKGVKGTEHYGMRFEWMDDPSRKRLARVGRGHERLQI